MASERDDSRNGRTELPTCLWLGVPPGIVVLIIGAKLIGEDVYDRWIRSEWGAIENLTVVFLAVAVFTGIYLGRRSFTRDIDDGRLFLSGDQRLIKTFRRWLKFSIHSDADDIAQVENTAATS